MAEVMSTIRYTSEDELKYLEDGDRTVELKMYVHEIYAVKAIKTEYSKKRLFKFIVTNGIQKLYVSIWNDLIQDYEQAIQLNRIIHIVGGHCHKSNHHNKNPNILKVEVIIQPSTLVTYLGYHKEYKQIQNEEPKDVDFESIKNAVGLIRIKGYIKQPFISVSSPNGNMTFGSGSIACDKSRTRITVEIISYVNTPIDIGTCVVVTGTVVDNEGPLKIRWTNITSILILKDEPKMQKEDLELANRTIKRSSEKQN